MPKIRKKSTIHENADANITCDFGDGDISRSRSRLPPGLCSNALAFANASANAAFALALAFDSPVMAAFALAFAFDSSAFAFTLAFDSNAFLIESNAKQMRIKCHCITAAT